MLTEFELLIEELELEKLRLKEELNEFLQVQDYKYAQYFQKGIWLVERKIERLKQLNGNPISLDTQYLVDTIIELNKDIIRGFSLFFLSESDFYLHFYKLSENKLYCQIPAENEMLKAHYYVYRPSLKKNILSLGFDFNEESAGMEFTIDGDPSCSEVLTKLAIIMFDILHINPKATGYITKKI